MGMHVFNWHIQFWWLKGYIHSSCYYHHQIGSINLTHCCHFFRGCLRSLLHNILSLIAYTFRENRNFVVIFIVQFVMSANNRMHFGLQIVFVCLYITPSHYHHCANLSEDNELIKCMSDIFCPMCKIKHIFPVILYTIYGAICFRFFYQFPLWWLREYTLCLIIIIKSEVWTIIHCLGLGHEGMAYAVCLYIFLQWSILSIRPTYFTSLMIPWACVHSNTSWPWLM